MRKTMKAAVLSFSIFTVSPGAFAGAGHDHGHSHEPVTQAQAETLATTGVTQLITSGKLDGSWKTVAAAKSEQKEFKGSKEWVVSFKNASVSDPSKQTLYVFLTLGGELIAVNYTGK